MILEKKQDAEAVWQNLFVPGVSSFKIEDGFTLSEVEAMRDADTLLEHIVPVDEVFLLCQLFL